MAERVHIVVTSGSGNGGGLAIARDVRKRLEKEGYAARVQMFRGLGELVIGLAYGPWMVLGSLYLHTGAAPGWAVVLASLMPGLLIASLAVVNAIPDFHQDRLVGKRNLVVRVGRRRAVWLYVALAALALLIVPLGVAMDSRGMISPAPSDFR